MGEIAKAYGNFIKGRRIDKGMTQTEVAKALGISQVAYSRYELGQREPNFDLILSISALLEFKPSEFFDGYMKERFSYSERLDRNDSDNR